MRPSESFVVFPSQLGWMGMYMRDKSLAQLTFGHSSAKAAKKPFKGQRDIDCVLWSPDRDSPAIAEVVKSLIKRLRAYAAGSVDDFRDVRLDYGVATVFQRQVWNQCRRIPYGQTISYANLAVRAGYPGAARAVGSCMAANQVPLVVPCHRVVCADGRLGAYSAPGGVATKRRLLWLESS